MSSNYNEDEDKIQFSNGVGLTRDQIEAGGFGTLTDTIFRFSRSLAQMDVDDTEFSLLSAICLISGGNDVKEKQLLYLYEQLTIVLGMGHNFFVQILKKSCLADRSGLEDSEKVERLQEPILEALKHYVRKRRPQSPHSFAKMLMKLTDLRSISVKGASSLTLVVFFFVLLFHFNLHKPREKTDYNLPIITSCDE